MRPDKSPAVRLRPEEIAAFPADAAGLGELPAVQRVAATALLESVEQLEGGLAGLFRAILRLPGVGLRGLYPLDTGNHMAQLGALDEPEHWVATVRLRDKLVHEYPRDPAQSFARLARAALPSLLDAAARAARCVPSRGLLP